MGREYLNVLRTTWVVDEAGPIAQVFERVNPDRHSAEIFGRIDKRIRRDRDR